MGTSNRPPSNVESRVVSSKSNDVSDKHFASIFKVEEQDKLEDNMKQLASRTLIETEYETDTFLRNVDRLSLDYMALHPRI
jgi:hypothetical protein